MRSHRHPYAHLAQRAAEPQFGQFESQVGAIITNMLRSPETTRVRAASPTPTTNQNQNSNGNGNTRSGNTNTNQNGSGNGNGNSNGNSNASSTGILIGAPVFATPNASPSPTQQSSNNNNDDSNDNTQQNNSPSPVKSPNASPSPTDQSDQTDGSDSAPSTTFATSTLPNSNANPYSTSNSYGGSNSASYTSSSAGSSTTGAGVSGSSSSSGMSTGAKIGLAVGIIGILGAFALFLMLFMAKKRKQREAREKVEDEKRAAEQAAAAASAAAAKQKAATPNAPRLSLRPVSRLVPDLMGGNRSKNRLSQGNMLTTFSETRGDRSQSPANNMYSSRPRENPFTDPVNPFNDPEKAAAAGAAYQQPRSYAHELEDTRSMGSASRPDTAHSQFPGAPAPAVATGPGPDQPQGNVYRILMDFKPTMEDELELRAGTHVRMLHEYDDGWALCIRLDRSQQGVVPRTCLAAKPSKPRPAPGSNSPGSFRGSPGPQSRPITPSTPGGPRMNSPSGQPFRSESPANRGPDYRPQTSGSGASRQDHSMAQGNFNQAPRPLSPGPRPNPQKRSESPGPYGAGGPQPMYAEPQRQRSNSTNNPNAGPRNPPPGPSNLGSGAPAGPGFAY